MASIRKSSDWHLFVVPALQRSSAFHRVNCSTLERAHLRIVNVGPGVGNHYDEHCDLSGWLKIKNPRYTQTEQRHELFEPFKTKQLKRPVTVPKKPPHASSRGL